MPNIKIEIHAFKIGFLMAIGWDVGKIVCNVSERILLKILESRVAALQKKLDEEKVSEEE